MRILLIEDNVSLSNVIKIGLEEFNFKVDISNTGEDGEFRAWVNEYDLILLDLNLPDIDGVEVLKYLRHKSIDTPIIIITARDSIRDLTNGLDNGADDYIIKPFQLLELKSRIYAVIRRYYGHTKSTINIGNIELNSLSRTVYIENKLLDLSVKEFDIFEYICLKHPAIVSSEDIAEHVYDENFNPFSSVLRVHISRLKNKVNMAYGKEILVNIRGKGYCLCEK